MKQSTRWLPEEIWQHVQTCLPILCVDVLPFRVREGKLSGIGLIQRHTPHQSIRWCLIGGRLQYGELIPEAILRELREALGDELSCVIDTNPQPIAVVEYLPTPKLNQYHDPRKHAIGLTYAIEVSGNPSPRGEALGFQWFKPTEIPDDTAMGFDHGRLVADCLKRLVHF